MDAPAQVRSENSVHQLLQLVDQHFENSLRELEQARSSALETFCALVYCCFNGRTSFWYRPRGTRCCGNQPFFSSLSRLQLFHFPWDMSGKFSYQQQGYCTLCNAVAITLVNSHSRKSLLGTRAGVLLDWWGPLLSCLACAWMCARLLPDCMARGTGLTPELAPLATGSIDRTCIYADVSVLLCPQ